MLHGAFPLYDQHPFNCAELTRLSHLIFIVFPYMGGKGPREARTLAWSSGRGGASHFEAGVDGTPAGLLVALFSQRCVLHFRTALDQSLDDKRIKLSARGYL